MMTEEHFDNFADNTTKSSVGKLPKPFYIFACLSFLLKDTFRCMKIQQRGECLGDNQLCYFMTEPTVLILPIQKSN